MHLRREEASCVGGGLTVCKDGAGFDDGTGR